MRDTIVDRIMNSLQVIADLTDGPLTLYPLPVQERFEAIKAETQQIALDLRRL